MSDKVTDETQCTTSGGLNVGFVLAGAFSHKIAHVKWQIGITSVLLTAFLGALSGADGSNLAIPVVFTIIGAASIGWIEGLVGSAGPLSLDAKDIGSANGVQWGLRTLTSSLASELNILEVNLVRKGLTRSLIASLYVTIVSCR